MNTRQHRVRIGEAATTICRTATAAPQRLRVHSVTYEGSCRGSPLPTMSCGRLPRLSHTDHAIIGVRRRSRDRQSNLDMCSKVYTAGRAMSGRVAGQLTHLLLSLSAVLRSAP